MEHAPAPDASPSISKTSHAKSAVAPVVPRHLRVAIWLSVFFSTLTLAALVLFGVYAHRWYVVDSIDRDEVRAERRLNTPAKGPIEQHCTANVSGIQCTFTNTNNWLVGPACLVGVVERKSDGRQIQSMTVCSGNIARFDTREVTAHWERETPEQLCYKETNYGTSMDWGKCTFDIKPRSFTP